MHLSSTRQTDELSTTGMKCFPVVFIVIEKSEALSLYRDVSEREWQQLQQQLMGAKVEWLDCKLDPLLQLTLHCHNPGWERAISPPPPHSSLSCWHSPPPTDEMCTEATSLALVWEETRSISTKFGRCMSRKIQAEMERIERPGHGQNRKQHRNWTSLFFRFKTLRNHDLQILD